MEQNNHEQVHTILHKRIMEVRRLKLKEALSPLKSCDGCKLIAEVGNVNKIVKKFHTNDISELSSLLYSVTYMK